MKTFADIIDLFGGPARIARAIGVTTEHASIMKRRGSIPATYWQRVVSAAEQEGVNGITLDVLAAAAAFRASPSPVRRAS
ncbi:carph-isopro domain-containing protein [Pseudochelatococcus sp. B33]